VRSITEKEALRDFDSILNHVCDDHEPLIINRANGHAAVLISLKDYPCVDETEFLLRHPANADRLLKSIAAAESIVRPTALPLRVK